MVSRIQDGPVPKHEQLRSILEELISTELVPGDPLPGERALEEKYGVSRITVRRAIGDLVAAGRLRRVRGKGTFVAPAPLVSRLHLASFSDEMRAQRVKAGSRILLAERTTPPDEVTAFFGTPPTTEHIRLRRLRLGDGEPYAVDDAWYNSLLVPDLLENDVYHSVYTLLENEYELGITEAEQTVTAVTAGPDNAPLLDVTPDTALLHIVRYARSGGNNVEFCSSVYRTDRYRLTTRVAREVE
ncbi:GntR family transcriptional regulator [Corynebacterium lujinxingii]|uniref:GntR family transcriptional regulator n=1 Tax=Corynebacterium lujinxingii TaxID=2763010 RepID=A0A7H0JYJ4_9CORY|nr:GntR family transcriptional regulator [Corynebacterium lujinxingii]MBC3178181.1 GntR family transcriptional regulator [Corynebacterium lujinxingii]NNO10940.1 UTRA domain-containing protein [Corynebacterium lujinxingii]QNP90110.1 GntR family transcriptional regulator [Corynebacterium lujinxingii]